MLKLKQTLENLNAKYIHALKTKLKIVLYYVDTNYVPFMFFLLFVFEEEYNYCLIHNFVYKF